MSTAYADWLEVECPNGCDAGINLFVTSLNVYEVTILEDGTPYVADNAGNVRAVAYALVCPRCNEGFFCTRSEVVFAGEDEAADESFLALVSQ